MPSIDRDAPMRCLLYGKDRHIFLQEVDRQTEEAMSNINEAFEMKTPSGLYCSISQILVHSMHKVFPLKNSNSNTDIVHHRQQKRDIIIAKM